MGSTAPLQPEIHEARLLGAILAVDVYKSAKTPVETRDKIIALVLTRVEYLDNWDLVDTVAPYTPGPWLLDRSQGEQDAVLDDLTASPLLWRRRFAMVSTLAMVRAARGDRRMQDSLAREYRFTWRATQETDCLEGVRAQIIDKDRKPRWTADASPGHVAALLAPLGPNELTWEERA